MSILNFEMQGLKEKQKKSEKLGGLCTHGKVTTRQRTHVVVTCAFGVLGGGTGKVFAVRAGGRRTTKTKLRRTATDLARQRQAARQSAKRTTKH
jgi:hypothetical protein